MTGVFLTQLVAHEKIDLLNNETQENGDDILKNYGSCVSGLQNIDTPLTCSISMTCKDPLATCKEILALKTPKITMNQQLWAHHIPHIEPGCISLASENLYRDFERG